MDDVAVLMESFMASRAGIYRLVFGSCKSLVAQLLSRVVQEISNLQPCD